MSSLLRRSSSGFIKIQKLDIDEKYSRNEDKKERKKIQNDISMYTLWQSIVWLVNTGSNINIHNKEAWLKNTLHWAAESGKIEILAWIIDRGMNINITDKNLETPLHKASKYKHPQIVKWLLDHGADVNAKDVHGNTALHNAGFYGQLENLFYLISFNANINIVNDNKETALHKIMLHGRKDVNITMIDCLVQSKISINAVDKNGDSALHLAARTQKYEEFEYLVQRGGNVHFKNDFGETPLNVKKIVKDNFSSGFSLPRGMSLKR